MTAVAAHGEADADRPKRILPPFVFLAALIAMGALHYWLPGPEVVPNPWNRLGWVPFVLSVLLAIHIKLKFDRHGTTIKPYETSTKLVTDGPFRWSRNPIYTGMVVALLGFFVALGTLTPIVVVPVFAWLIQSRFIAMEERMLEEAFGDDYRAFKARVRRWI
jgi:protein-S-isoprenylcysteine O-methyltransferase Ste14